MRVGKVSLGGACRLSTVGTEAGGLPGEAAEVFVADVFWAILGAVVDCLLIGTVVCTAYLNEPPLIYWAEMASLNLNTLTTCAI